MAQTRARDAQRRRLAKPKPPVKVLKGKKRKSKLVIGPRAGIPVGLAALAAAIKKRKAAKEKKKHEAVKRILSTPKKKP